MNEEKDNITWSFSALHKPVAELSPEEVMVIETAGFNGVPRGEPGQGIAKTIPVTGPFYINGASAGDALEIEILEIKISAQGNLKHVPGTGVLTTPENRRIREYAASGNRIILAGDLTAVIQPALGVIGVAPASGDISTDLPGAHGGRLLAKEACAGSRVLLPVFQTGALLALGDVNVLLGDGVISGNGVGAGAAVKIKTRIIIGLNLAGPQILTEAGTFFLASAPTLTEAVRAACRRGVEYIAATAGLDFDEAYSVAGAIGQLGFCRAAAPPFTVKFFVPVLVK